MTSNVKQELLDLSDFAYQRLANRLDGCSNEEYMWEPVPDSWSVHANGDGTFRGDWGLIFDEDPPVTTIAWRLSHIVNCLAGKRCALILGLEPEPDIFAGGLPGTAQAGREMLERANTRRRGYVDTTDSGKLLEPSGPAAGPYADYSRAAFVLHILDELIHHGAEIGVLRDLYRAQRSEDAFVTACLRADRTAVDQLRAGDAGIVGRKIAEHPDLMVRAAATGRWPAVPLLVELGFPSTVRTDAAPCTTPPRMEGWTSSGSSSISARIFTRRIRSTTRRRSSGPSTSTVPIWPITSGP